MDFCFFFFLSSLCTLQCWKNRSTEFSVEWLTHTPFDLTHVILGGGLVVGQLQGKAGKIGDRCHIKLNHAHACKKYPIMRTVQIDLLFPSGQRWRDGIFSDVFLG